MIGINQSDLCQLSDSDLYRVLGDIKDFGFRSVRFAVDWGYWSNFWGSTNYSRIKAVAAAFEDLDLDPLPVLGIHYPFVHSSNGFSNHVAKVVDIFGDCDYYEVWNEPNLIAFNIGSPGDYLRYLRAAVPHIETVGAQVISAGLAAMPTFGVNTAPVTWMQKMEAAGEDNDFDILGYHPYSIANDQYSTFIDPHLNPFGMDQYSRLKIMYPTTPFALTEVGFDTSKVGLVDASNWLAYQLNSFDKNDLIWLFCWRDTAGDGGKYGIVDKGNQPKTFYYDYVKSLVS